MRKLISRKPFKHTRLMAVATPTDHPKLFRNCYVIEVFGGSFCRILTFLFSGSRGAFGIGIS